MILFTLPSYFGQLNCVAFGRDYRGPVMRTACADATFVMFLLKYVGVESGLATKHPIDGTPQFDRQERVGAGLVVFFLDPLGEGFGSWALTLEQRD